MISEIKRKIYTWPVNILFDWILQIGKKFDEKDKTSFPDRLVRFLSKNTLVRHWQSKTLFDWISQLDKKGEVRFLNYGYEELVPGANKLELEEKDELDRLRIQLYHKDKEKRKEVIYILSKRLDGG